MMFVNSIIPYRVIILLISVMFLISCASRKLSTTMTTVPSHFDWQGHRGCRGLMPENTIAGFLEALKYPVTTLEMDLVVTKDGHLVVSHEPWMDPSICSGPSHTKLSRAAKRTLNIYQLTLDEVRQYDCGSPGNEKFPRQNKQPAVKPLFTEVVHAVQEHCHRTGRAIPNLNVEIKSRKSWYDTYVPQPEVFVNKVLQQIEGLKVGDRITLQSFDAKVLREIHQQNPEIPISYLTEVSTGIVRAVRVLGFTPSVYSPNYRTLRKNTVDEAHARNVKVIPWTVNSVDLFEKMIGLGVDGMITDYPDLIEKMPFDTSTSSVRRKLRDRQIRSCQYDSSTSSES